MELIVEYLINDRWARRRFPIIKPKQATHGVKVARLKGIKLCKDKLIVVVDDDVVIATLRAWYEMKRKDSPRIRSFLSGSNGISIKILSWRLI